MNNAAQPRPFAVLTATGVILICTILQASESATEGADCHLQLRLYGTRSPVASTQPIYFVVSVQSLDKHAVAIDNTILIKWRPREKQQSQEACLDSAERSIHKYLLDDAPDGLGDRLFGFVCLAGPENVTADVFMGILAGFGGKWLLEPMQRHAQELVLPSNTLQPGDYSARAILVSKKDGVVARSGDLSLRVTIAEN